MPLKNCTLCNARALFFHSFRHRDYYKCQKCTAIMMDARHFLSPAEERARYEQHENCVDDPGYQRFVSPITDAIQEQFTPEAKGLDFGAGTGPVITKLLQDAGYSLLLYDPFFWNNPQVLQARYDFIACCEVMEHFQDPLREFRLLRSLLKPGGVLYCMTKIYSEDIDFMKWHYKNDPTHVFFYHQNTLRWIRAHLHFSRLVTSGNLIRFEA